MSRYLSAFDLGCVALTRDRRLTSTKNPVGCDRAWWLHSRDVGRVIRQARKDGDVEGAARALGIELAEHSVVAMRTESALAKLENGMQKAQRSGLLTQFNAQYRRRRLAAFEQGRGFMSYRTAQVRLQRVLVEIAATGEAPGGNREGGF
jgi:hypothetical protein